jgi:uncharacterized protein YdeI (YjbR/CyaY-like superfamily)
MIVKIKTAKNLLPVGTVHSTLPLKFTKLIQKNTQALAAWYDITPLARNEWLCWMESAKLIDTKERRIQRSVTELAEGVRRPCCWPGCIHREHNGK